MRSIQVQFPSGREVLSSYWGFLARGGLVLREPTDLSEGDALILEVRIKSLKQSYRFSAQVVRRAADGQRSYVAFDAGQDQEMMLNAAWADTHEVPQRKHRRFAASSQVLYGPADGNGRPAAQGRVIDVSRGGCRVKGTLAVPVGSRVKVSVLGMELVGKVRWTNTGCEFGVEFAQPTEALQSA
jgi:hypothetical protein